MLTSQDFPFSSCFISTDDGSFLQFGFRAFFSTIGDLLVSDSKQINDGIGRIFSSSDVERKMEIDTLRFLFDSMYLTTLSSVFSLIR